MILLLYLFVSISTAISSDLHLTTSDDGYMTVIQGFAARLECLLSTCVRHATTIAWFKDDIPLFNSTNFLENSGVDPTTVLLQHNVEFDKDKSCNGSCSDSEPCDDGLFCRDNLCCPCVSEEYTLVLKNLTFDDAGRYRCQISNQPEHLEFQVEVLESGLKGGFHENISYDYSECCQEKGISSLCRAMCRPKDMHIHHFDPTSCKTEDYKNFLSCATKDGNRSHVQCCKTQLVPSFCYDFCSGNFHMLRKSHRLCLYYLPEIFECYNRAYLPYPEHPLDLTVNAIDCDQLQACWEAPKSQSSNDHLKILYYTVYYKQIPSFPFLGGDDGMPLLSGDYEEPNLAIDDELSPDDNTAPSTPVSVMLRRKRQTWLFVTHDSTTNDSTIREFKFEEVNTTETCLTLSDLRSATRYIIYVTATNEFGVSVPSLRTIATTNSISVSNITLPQIEQCCSKNGVSSYCASKMCNVQSVPNALETIAISTSCRLEWSKVSPCLADGRNHTDCCKRKGVQHDCLKICGGIAEPLSVHSLLCLNLDIVAIFQCLREGYENHPSPPMNVTLDVRGHSVEIRWLEPESNAHLVESTTLFIANGDADIGVIAIHNATSPHVEYGLDPDTEYTAYLQNHGSEGDSLYSTAHIFITQPLELMTCEVGEPLLNPDGHRYSCIPERRSCPPLYECIVPEESDAETYCCPKPEAVKSFALECCRARGVSPACSSQCLENATLTADCAKYGDIWVQCVSDGQDYSACCIESGVPNECLNSCHHPFMMKEDCIAHAPLLSKCFNAAKLNSPKTITNLEVVYSNTTSVFLTWDSTDNTEIYEVLLIRDNDIYKKVNTTGNSYKFTNLKPGMKYAVKVISYGNSISSPPSLEVTFHTLNDDDIDSRPVSPTKLHIVWNHGKRLNVSWYWEPKLNNGEIIHDKPIFNVEYVPAYRNRLPNDKTVSWTTKTTNEQWYIMEDLTMDMLYDVYVTAMYRGTESHSSSILTIIAAPDEVSIPEPKIEISPNYVNRTYDAGQKINLKCSTGLKEAHLFLTIGEANFPSEPSSVTVEASISVNENISLITCTVADHNGRQNRAHAYIFIRFGPEISIPKPLVIAYDDLSTEIHCIVKSYPVPEVTWTYRAQNSLLMQSLTRVLMKRISRNEYDFILHVRNVTNRDGIYSCRAKTFDNVLVSKEARLAVAKAILPLNPRFILQCCVDAKVSETCLKACSVNPEVDADCSAYSHDLISCAKDGLDHKRCCSQSGVPHECLGLCSNDSSIDLPRCALYANKAVACMIRGHEKAPRTPGPVHYEHLSPTSVKIRWSEVDPISYKVYAVYYRQEKKDGEFKVKKSTESEIILTDLQPDTNYDFALVSANSFGHSPLFESKIFNAHYDEMESQSSLFLPTAFILIVLIIAIVGILSTTRTIALPPFIRCWKQSPLSDTDPTVAFENPGFRSAVQIRGLSSQDDQVSATDWQNADLEIANNSIGRGTSNGMRYAKLESK